MFIKPSYAIVKVSCLLNLHMQLSKGDKKDKVKILVHLYIKVASLALFFIWDCPFLVKGDFSIRLAKK